MTKGVPSLTEVKSSNIDKVGRQGEDLFIRFKSGGLYRYPKAGHLFDEAVGAESVGSFFRSKIMGKFVHQSVEPNAKPKRN